MKRWWMLCASIIIAFAISLCFFSVRVRIAPRLVLTAALNRTIIDLESRFERSPVHLLENVIDPAGRHQAQVQLLTELPLLGAVRYDMELQTQLTPFRVSGSGTVVSGGSAMNLSLYLDKDFAAVSSGNLADGGYYGITYDTFSQDIRSRDMLAYLIGDDTISRWDAGVTKLNQFMSQNLTMPNLSLADICSARYAVLALNPEVSMCQTDVAGEMIKAHSVAFRASGDQIVKAAEHYSDKLSPELVEWINNRKEDPNFCAEIIFFLDKGMIIKLEIGILSSDDSAKTSICFGNQDNEGSFSMDVTIQSEDNLKQISLLADNTYDSEYYEENAQLTYIENSVRNYVIEYSYDQRSGEMDLCVIKDIRKAKVRMHLAGEGNRLTITTQNAGCFLDLFREIPLNIPAICTISIMPGERVPVPAYHNLDQWSIEDIWVILESMGRLIGIK